MKCEKTFWFHSNILLSIWRSSRVSSSSPIVSLFIISFADISLAQRLLFFVPAKNFAVSEKAPASANPHCCNPPTRHKPKNRRKILIDFFSLTSPLMFYRFNSCQCQIQPMSCCEMWILISTEISHVKWRRNLQASTQERPRAFYKLSVSV